MRIRAVLLPCAALALLVAGCGSSISEYEPEFANGGIIYDEACARCHDEASDAPLLLRGEVRRLTREKIEDALANGRGGMPRFPLIGGEYRDALVEFILRRQDLGGP